MTDLSVEMQSAGGPYRAHPAAPALRFLTEDDFRLILERATQHEFARGDVIIEEGSQRQAIVLVRAGFVRVERAHLGRGVAIQRCGPGEVLGEQSFIEGNGASASVIADDAVSVTVIEATRLYPLLVSVPGLATRFYQSLALVLSERLRATTASLPPLIVEDVPQVALLAALRGQDQTRVAPPPSLVDVVEVFKTAMLDVDRGVKDRKISEEDAQNRVILACNALITSLDDHVQRDGHLELTIGRYVFRETFPYMMLSRFIDRAYSKPRGYAGDFATIEMLYEDVATGDGRLGPFIDRWTREIAAARAVKNRRRLLAEEILRVASEWHGEQPVRVTSLAAGPARELFDVLALPNAPDLVATCVDIDHEALRFAAARAEHLGLADRFTFAQDNVVRLCKGRGHTALPPQAMIYSVGLTDYLNDEYVVDLINWAYANLLPGGTLVIGNVVPTNPDKAFMDHILEWVLIHRSEAELRSLISRSLFRAASLRLREEPAGVDLFAICRKE
jgi:extracellular factor (EF) 3-hydroxypalmitic acid methyl ester biosynthesis protein